MKKQNIFRSLKSVLLVLTLFSLSSPALGSEIVTCLFLKTKGEHRCIIKSQPHETVHIGDEVVAYKKDIYWVGTGKVLKVKGIYSVAAFKNASRSIAKGHRAEIYPPSSIELIDWAAAFSKKD